MPIWNPQCTFPPSSYPRTRPTSQALPPLCRHKGCPEQPRHGRMGGRPLWCHNHFVSQSSHHPLRCAVLQRTTSGDYLACWNETTWGWPGKPPTRCETHKTKGQQKPKLVEVTSLLKRVFKQVSANEMSCINHIPQYISNTSMGRIVVPLPRPTEQGREVDGCCAYCSYLFLLGLRSVNTVVLCGLCR